MGAAAEALSRWRGGRTMLLLSQTRTGFFSEGRATFSCSATRSNPRDARKVALMFAGGGDASSSSELSGSTSTETGLRSRFPRTVFGRTPQAQRAMRLNCAERCPDERLPS